MPDRHRFIDVPPPDVAWVVAGPAASLGEIEPPARHLGVGERVGEGVVVLPGVAGQPAARHDARGRPVAAVPQLLDDDADTAATPIEFDDDEDDVDVWLDRLAAAGVRPDRVNCPDLLGQLRAARGLPPDLVLCSAIDADPMVPLQIEWALRHPRAFRDGLRLIGRLTGARRAIVAVSYDEARRLSRALRKLDGRPAAQEADDEDRPAEQPTDVGKLRLVPVPPAYPQGDPTLMAATLASRKLKPLASPTSAGLIVLDAVAAVAIGQVAQGAACVRREPIALRDHRAGIEVLAEVWRGSRLCDALLFLGMLHRDPERDLREKGDAAGVTVRADDYLRDHRVPTTLLVGNGPLVYHVETAGPSPSPEPCIRCGWCLDICPTALNPAGLLDADAAAGPRRHKLSVRHGAAACIGCGLCDHACPSRLPLRDVATRLRDEGARGKEEG